MATIVNNTQRIIILASTAKSLYLQPGINFVDSEDLKLMSREYIDSHVDLGNLVVSYDKRVKVEKPKKAKEADSVVSEIEEIELLD